MGKLIDQHARIMAVEHAVQLVKHCSNQLFDRVVELDDLIAKEDPVDLIEALGEITKLSLAMPATVELWKAFLEDLTAHREPKPIVAAPTADNGPACTCPPMSAIHLDGCPRAAWIVLPSTAPEIAGTPEQLSPPADPTECTCGPERFEKSDARHDDVCPRGNWLKKSVAATAPSAPDEDIPF